MSQSIDQRRGVGRLIPRALLVLGVMLSLVWFGRGSGKPQLISSVTGSSDATEQFVVWIDKPSRHALAAARELHLDSDWWVTALASDANSAEQARQALRIWRAAKEVLVSFDSERASVELRLSPALSVVLKAVGVAGGNPWLRGGRVTVGERPASVRWLKGDGWVADRWHFAIGGSSRRTTNSDRDSVAVDGAIALVRVPADRQEAADAKADIWALAPVEQARGLRWQRRTGKGSTAVERGGQPWWLSAPSFAAHEGLVLGAAQRSGDAWQTLAWLPSKIEVSQDKVAIELPRAATLVSNGHPAPWPLPAERMARALDAEFEERTIVWVPSLDTPFDDAGPASGAQLRSLSPAASQLVTSQAAALEGWALALPNGALAGAIDLGELIRLAAAIRRMERMTGASGSLGRNWEKLGLEAIWDQYGGSIDSDEPLLFQLEPDVLVLAR